MLLTHEHFINLQLSDKQNELKPEEEKISPYVNTEKNLNKQTKEDR